MLYQTFFSACIRDFFESVYNCTGYDFHGERGARTYNGGLGPVPPARVKRAEPPVGVRGKAL